MDREAGGADPKKVNGQRGGPERRGDVKASRVAALEQSESRREFFERCALFSCSAPLLFFSQTAQQFLEQKFFAQHRLGLYDVDGKGPGQSHGRRDVHAAGAKSVRGRKRGSAAAPTTIFFFLFKRLLEGAKSVGRRLERRGSFQGRDGGRSLHRQIRSSKKLGLESSRGREEGVNDFGRRARVQLRAGLASVHLKETPLQRFASAEALRPAPSSLCAAAETPRRSEKHSLNFKFTDTCESSAK